MASVRVYILTAVHNDLVFTKKLLASINKQTYKNIKTYIVDDGSTDETHKFVRNNYPSTVLLRGDGNLWWTGSLNMGINKILISADDRDYIWIINNDCVFGKRTIEKALNCLKIANNKKTIVGSIIIDSKTNKFSDGGVIIDWKSLRFDKTKYFSRKNDPDALSTKGTLYPIIVFKELGLFDARHFPHYFSDYEYSIRAKRNGYSLKICPQSKIYNETGRTGIEEAPTGLLNIQKKYLIGFSRKSKLNIQTQINIVRFVCPQKYRLRNYFSLTIKMFNKIFA